VIVGTGGYASFPALYAGSGMGIPTCVHESNAVPGVTTKMAAARASRVLVSFPESAQYYRNQDKVEVVGMPVRKEFILTGKEEAKAQLGLDHRPVVVSAFGSLGARMMNFAVADMFKLEKEDNFPFQHIHATGSFGWEWMPEHVASLDVDVNGDNGIDMREYIYNMPTVMAAADVIISRAGASTCNEIGASGTPSILIPSPNVTNNHQEKNARILEGHGAAIVITEDQCSGKVLYNTVQQLLEDHDRRKAMSAAVRDMVVLDSAERICDLIEHLARGGK
jgi:UDP-N-acetylglucosamine--N-acetylmuramyl-(pentapeptide) pyrophosphoryl-undecaprenol N-acetylglucosamine transferase